MEITVQELAELIRECSKSEKTKTSTRSSNCGLCTSRTYRRCWDNNKVVLTIEDLDDGRVALNIFDKNEELTQQVTIAYCPFCGREL